MIRSTAYTALVLARKEAFYQWLAQANKLSMTNEDNQYEGDHGTYLLSNVITQKQVDTFVERNYLLLLRNELIQWHPEEFWPENPGLELFYLWFDVQINREVYLVDNPET